MIEETKLGHWHAMYNLWLSPLSRDGIVISVLLFYTLARYLKRPPTRLYILSVAAVSYLLGCAASVWVFYLKFGYFRFLEPGRGYGMWEELVSPYKWYAHPVWLHGLPPPHEGVYQRYMEAVVWPYYIWAPLLELITFCVSAFLIVWISAIEQTRPLLGM